MSSQLSCTFAAIFIIQSFILRTAAAEYEDESATEDVELEEAKSEEPECGCGCSEQ